MADAVIRLLSDDDSLDALTALLHRAYARLAAQGFRYRAVDQSVEVTRHRIAKGECYVLLQAEQIAGTILLVPPSARAAHCAYYDRPEVAVFGQFAVAPELQGRGLGERLLRFVEARALELGAVEGAVDTAENAHDLIRYYTARGYRHVGYAQWKHTNYRSVILSRALREAR